MFVVSDFQAMIDEGVYDGFHLLGIPVGITHERPVGIRHVLAPRKAMCNTTAARDSAHSSAVEDRQIGSALRCGPVGVTPAGTRYGRLPQGNRRVNASTAANILCANGVRRVRLYASAARFRYSARVG